MGSKELSNILNEILRPDGFKKKGNTWSLKNDAITKIVNLQKSNFGNRYYINYGYNINALALDNILMHYFNRVTSIDTAENQKINELLALDSSLPDEERSRELRDVIQNNLLSQLRGINTEEDLRNKISKMENRNSIPFIVKKYFKME